MRRLTILIGVAVMVLAMVAPVYAGPKDKTWVCHATNSEANPWVIVHVANGWDRGHGNGGPAKHQTADFEIVPFEGIRPGPAPVGVCDDSTPVEPV